MPHISDIIGYSFCDYLFRNSMLKVSIEFPGLKHNEISTPRNTLLEEMLQFIVMPDVRIPEREERTLPRQCNSQKREVYC